MKKRGKIQKGKNETWVQRFLNEIKKKQEEAGRKKLYPQQSLEFTFYTGAQKCFGSYTQKAN